MAPVVIPSTLQVILNWTFNGAELGLNVMNSIIGPGPIVDQTMANTIAGLLDAAHASSGLIPLQPTSINLTSVRIRDIRTANKPLIEAAVGSPGTAAVDLLPRGNALVVTHRTAAAGRSFRGRSYVPGFAENATGPDGRATAAAQTAAFEFLTDFNAAMTTNGWPMGVMSQKLLVTTPITVYQVRNGIWDRQWGRALRGATP